jgi:DNA polymerase-3 subunit epsilon
MGKKLPLVFIDLETTGTDISTARIVSFAYKLGEKEGHYLINPGIPIPKEATDIHGITDEMVADRPKFSVLASSILELLQTCAIAGYNVLRFDLPLLAEELLRSDESLVLPSSIQVVDAFSIFQQKEGRSLSDAVQFYCGREHDDAHNALGDVKATEEVLRAQLKRYGLTADVNALHELSTRGKPVADWTGYFSFEGGIYVFNFGKHKGKHALGEKSYLKWMLEADFPLVTKKFIREVLL